MPANPSVVAALEAALSADPENAGLRVHLAEVFLAAQDPVAALDHLHAILARQPEHLEALRLASRAAEAMGDLERAMAWRRLHDSFSSPSQGAAHEGRAQPAPVEPAEDGDVAGVMENWDALLDQVLAQQVSPPRLTLADIGGLEDVKRRLNTTFLAPLRNPNLRSVYSQSLRGGLLLWGPPGCGKTMVARAVAGELGAGFLSVGLHDVLDMWLGESEQKLHAAFQAARRLMPCVLFLDEIDALGHKRTNLVRSAGRNVVAQLLTELDGIGENNEGLFVLAASNQPWDIDPALRRPGRLDRTVLVLPPDLAARKAILRFHLKDRPVSGLDLNVVAQRTEGYSGADLRLVCDDAAARALEASIGSTEPKPVDMSQVLAAVADVRPSTGPWFEVAQNYAMFANQAGEYDELGAYMRSRRL